MAASVDGTMLIVCAANVCRSPYAAFALKRDLPHASVRSAGVTARIGDEICRFTRERIDQHPSGSDFIASHAATRLDRALIDQADLILTASEAERSAVAVIDPKARTRTFTLVEAAYGVQFLAGSARLRSLADVADALNAQRGRVPLPKRRPRRWLREAAYGIAIPDAHIGDTQNHEVVYRSIEDAVGRFTRALDRAPAHRQG